jgi:hypothetical protein
MIKSKVGYLCLNCGNLVEHGHSAVKPEQHKAEANHQANHVHSAHHEHAHHHEHAAHHHEHRAHHEAEPAPAKKPAAKKSSAGTTIWVKTRTVSDIKRSR